MKIRRDIFSFRNRVVVIIVGIALGMVSLLYTNNMAKRLKEKEQHDVAPSCRRNTTSRTAYGSVWPKRRPTSWARRPRRFWDGSNTCVRRTWIREPSRR